LENHNNILALHKSSQERLPYYLMVYKKIFAITGSPTRIVDFACGLNPFSYSYISSLGYKPEYLACDLALKDLEFIQEYFKIMKIKGAIQKVDLVKENLNKLAADSDLVFLFKTLDSLEAIKWNVSEQVIKEIKAKHIIVSFSTKSLGGKKPIKKEKRAWFERLCKKLGYKTESFEIPNEIFYVLTK